MLTVQEAARRTGRNPETIRRWIRSGRLRSKKVGTQHLIDEVDLEDAIDDNRSLPLPDGWDKTWTGEPMPDWVALVRELRDSR
ncbi:MAG: helix-turn-helix domain-containing protein [Acidimicrobiia bacterium]